MSSGRTDNNIELESCVAGADLSTTGQFLFCEIAAGKVVTVCNAATDLPYGVIYGEPTAAGQPVEVAVEGEVSVIADGTTPIAVGDWIGTAATGRAVKKSTAADIVRGIALEATSANGVSIQVKLIGPFVL
jgi:hypothetical protein